jgi:hypothetical protein
LLAACACSRRSLRCLLHSTLKRSRIRSS